MPPSRIGFAILFGFLAGAAPLGAQAERPGERRAGPPGIVASYGLTHSADSTLATVRGEPLTARDLDAGAQAAAAGLDAEMSRLRRQALEDAIDARLLERHARGRHTTADQIYFAEVIEKLAPPDEAELRAEK